MYRFWTDEKLEALKKLAKLSTRYRPNGVPIRPMRWNDGLEKLKTQDFEAYKVMKDIPMKRIKSGWMKYQNVVHGFCSTSECGNKIKKGEIYCPTCLARYQRDKARKYTGYIYTRGFTTQNQDLVKRSLDKIPATDLKRILSENVSSLPIKERKRLLSDDYKKAAKERVMKEESKD